jgi:hypothetical protein
VDQPHPEVFAPVVTKVVKDSKTNELKSQTHANNENNINSTIAAERLCVFIGVGISLSPRVGRTMGIIRMKD